MTLIIKAVSYKDAPLTQEISARFEEQGGSIGRSPDNRMVLPDPEKYISRLHAEIQYEGGQYFIRDCSAGGTYLERQGQLLQQNRAVLINGERLRIGEYELTVTVSESEPPFSPSSHQSYAEPVRQLDFADRSALDGPFAPLSKPAAKAETQQSFIEQPDASIFHQSFTPPEVSASGPVKEEIQDDLDFGDLLSTLDHLPSPPSAPIGHAPKTASASLAFDFPELPADFFADESKPEAAFAPQAHPDLPASPFAPATAGHQNLKAPNEPSPSFPSSPFHAEDVPDSADRSSSFTAAASADIAESKTQDSFSFSPGSASVAAPRAPEPNEIGAMAADSELVRAFLAGAGIDDPQFLPPEQWPALFRTSGELLHSMVEGLMCVLRARAELKSQFRVSVTTMRSVDNNPLKFTPNVDDALRLILAPTNPGFLTPKEAVREGFADIMNHQMAMAAGIQAALADVLRGFDPESIEKAQGDGIQFQKKAKCWEQYANQYPKLKAAAQEEFFGDAFGDAYEQQMQLLSRSSKR